MSTAIEQLRTASHLALRSQHTSQFDAASLVRAWPQVASAAEAAQRGLAGVESSHDLQVERIALDARSLDVAAQRLSWPGRGRTDRALTQVAAALRRSAKTNTAAEVQPSDLAEANRLIASSLWTTSQLVGRAARDHSVDLRMNHRGSPAHLEVASIVRDVHRRFNAVEQLAANALAELGLRRPVPTNVGTQLRQAVAVWDVQAHRALLDDRSTTVLHVLAHLEAESVATFRGFVTQATHSGILDKVTAGRLTPILHDSSSAWEQLRDAAAELSFGNSPVPISLITAGEQLRERFADATSHSRPEDHAEILHALTGHLSSGVTISASVRDLIETGELRAPARAIARVMTDQFPGRLTTPVNAVAIHLGQTLTLTPETRAILAAPARRVFLDADEAVNRAAGLDVLYRNPGPIEPSQREGRNNASPQGPPPAMSAPSRSSRLTP